MMVAILTFFSISFEESLETLPADDSFSRDGIAIMVAGHTHTFSVRADCMLCLWTSEMIANVGALPTYV